MPDRDDPRPPITADDVDGAKKIFELLDGELFVDGTSHGSGAHARLLLHLLAHPGAMTLDAPDAIDAPPITAAEFEAAGDLTVELIDGDLYLGGRSLGHGAAAHAVLAPRATEDPAAALAAALEGPAWADARLHLAELIVRHEVALEQLEQVHEALTVFVAALPPPAT